jgi:hypothetical protein
MENKKIAKIVTISKEELQTIVNEAATKRDIIKRIGYDNIVSGHYMTLNSRIKKDKINLEKFNKNFEEYQLNKTVFGKDKTDINNILVENSTFNRCHLKDRLIKEKLLDYICAICSNTGIWQGKPLSLQLDHINGINNDNRIENLRFLCPNCHAQTDTFAGKKLTKEKNKCVDCGDEIDKHAKRCRKCANKNNQSFDVSKEELEKLVLTDKLSYTKIAKKYDVSDGAIRKRCIKLGIEIPKRKIIKIK